MELEMVLLTRGLAEIFNKQLMQNFLDLDEVSNKILTLREITKGCTQLDGQGYQKYRVKQIDAFTEKIM